MFIPRFLRRTYVSPEEEAYLRLARKGYTPRSIVDVGAYEGNWTRLAKKYFPDANVLMCEAQKEKSTYLQKVCSDLENVEVSIGPLSSKPGELLEFYEMETGSSLFPENSNVARDRRVLATKTLDDVAAHLEGPIFLKIDAQGAELLVLEGGEETLRRCDMVQLEVALLKYNRGAPSFLDVVSYMDERAFVPFDLSGWSRPNGEDLVQIDILFVKEESPLRPSFFKF